MKPKTLFYRRQFLNDDGHGGSAHVEAFIKTTKKANQLYARFGLGDCFRVVSLDFDVDKWADAEHVRRKALEFRNAVIDFTDALDKALAHRRRNGSD